VTEVPCAVQRECCYRKEAQPGLRPGRQRRERESSSGSSQHQRQHQGQHQGQHQSQNQGQQKSSQRVAGARAGGKGDIFRGCPGWGPEGLRMCLLDSPASINAKKSAVSGEESSHTDDEYGHQQCALLAHTGLNEGLL